MGKVKHEVWQSEHEWRLMWRNDESEERVYKCPIGGDAIATIFLGLKLPEDQVERLVLAAKSQFPSARVFRAQKRHGDFALDF
jgi:hypothetical protein